MRPEDSSVAIIQGVNAPHQFSYENGIVLTDVGPGYAKGELIIGPDSINPHGNVHGGALSTLADTVGGCCACSKGHLRHLRLLHRIPPPGKRQQNLLHRHPQKAGPHPVGGSPGDDQRPGGGGGHRHLYLLHAALTRLSRQKSSNFPRIFSFLPG